MPCAYMTMIACLPLVGLAASCGRGPEPVASPPLLEGNWSQVWADEFDGTTLGSAWRRQIWDRPYHGPAKVKGGQFHLSATNATTPALVCTNQAFWFRYGYVEARLRVPKGRGLLPAFWMMPMPASGANDDQGEIDIVEVLGDDPRTVVATYHWGKRVDGTDYPAGVDLSADYHTYAVDWQADRITWYFDGKPIKVLTSKQAPIVGQQMYLILSVWLKGWRGPPDATTPFPATMEVDYIRVWQRGKGRVQGSGFSELF